MLALPAGAMAGNCAPPGNSGVDQYFETVPGAGCNAAGGGPGTGRGHGGSLPPATSRQLAAQGPAGQAVAQFAGATGPAPGASTGAGTGPGASNGVGSNGGSGHPARPGSSNGPASHGSGLLSGLLYPFIRGTGSGGSGLLLPLLLAAVLAAALGAAGWAVMRRRRSA